MSEFSSVFGNRSYSRVQTYNSANTAYTGADGHIDHTDWQDDNFGDDVFDVSPSRIAKPTLSTRLLSGAQPAAAAALTRSKSILHSRAKSLAAWTSSSFNNTITPISEGSPAPAAGANRIFGDLFSGESAPVRLGIPATSPTKEREESEFVMDYRPSLTQRSSFASPRRKSAATSQHVQPTKQSWFGRKSIAPLGASAVNDELLTLNINNSLFPNGPADPLSPSDFHDLLLNATSLLERMQNAYREKVEYIASIQPEIDAQREEAEEAETRAQHLKMQLEDMGRKAQDHELAMSQLSAQLTQEKIKAQEGGMHADDDTTPRRRKRGSAGSASDSGFESDWDRASTASSSVQTPRTPPATYTASPFDGLDQRLHDRQMKLQRQVPARANNLGCGVRNAEDSSTAWHTVQQLRGENQELRKQMESMQHTLQGCIEFVDTAHMW